MDVVDQATTGLKPLTLGNEMATRGNMEVSSNDLNPRMQMGS